MPSPHFSKAFLAEDRRTPAAVGMIVTTALSTIVVVVRLYARGCLIREMGWDDYLIVAAQLVAWIDCALSLMDIHYGAGQHLATLMSDPEKLVLMYKWLVAAQFIYFLTLWLCRVSGLAFYARVNPMPRFKLYLRISFAFVTAVYITQTLIIGLQCIPIQALWDPSVKGQCMGSTAVFISTSVLTIVCDSLILLLPVNIVLSIQASLSRKLVLLFVFCFGIFAVVTSILRMIAMINALHHPTDITWYFSVVVAWSQAEISAMIIALSLPALRGLFGFFRKQRSTAGHSNSNGTGSIGLGSVPRPTRHRIFDGLHQNTVDIDTQRSPSQEALWDVKDESAIRVMDTVHVAVDGVPHHVRS